MTRLKYSMQFCFLHAAPMDEDGAHFHLEFYPRDLSRVGSPVLTVYVAVVSSWESRNLNFCKPFHSTDNRV